ncbi:hypothetical protein [Streptomyces sp. Tu6071]|uniref:hypothetical protein n=1 Tax=Streptomyces sp. Tu6071 TaxID=355249 RepID=UPI001319FBA0|nr:hypothetical protein [Streptomyces sp. Tu6071]
MKAMEERNFDSAMNDILESVAEQLYEEKMLEVLKIYRPMINGIGAIVQVAIDANLPESAVSAIAVDLWKAVGMPPQRDGKAY